MNFGRRLDFHPMRAPEDGAGAAAPAGSPDPGGAGGQATGGEGSPSPYRPEGLPDHLYGASDRETLDKVFGAYKPAREAIAREKQAFETYRANTEREFVEYKRQFTLGADRMVSFDGRRVTEGALGERTRQEMESLESYGAEWIGQVRD